ncbi:MAG: sulfite oxidase-like oxidoreductase [Anaerolineae bacterium]|nr:MAG: oxidoreductase molybdopterin binding protein [Chloroflexi bacterium OLB13]MBW7880726.1 sulfite oxidase-like oxidoreductase [Anaerolineae bacterium]
MGVLDTRKTRREREDELRKQGRLPAGQSLTDEFPVLTYGPTPRFNPAAWDLRLFGTITHELRWDWETFQQLPTVQITTDIHCVTRWSKFDTVWEGVQFKHIAELAGMKPETKHIIAHCDYGYTTNVPVEDMLRDNVLLAYKFDGQPLDPEHGGPLRTLVPHLYFWKSAKFVRALEFSVEDKPGFWEVNGYHNYGDPFKEERYSRRGFF